MCVLYDSVCEWCVLWRDGTGNVMLGGAASVVVGSWATWDYHSVGLDYCGGRVLATWGGLPWWP